MTQPNKNTSDRKQVMKFISDIGSKNYANAKQSLKMAIEKKLFNKINANKNINIFRDE
jgi:hypothetical protein